MTAYVIATIDNVTNPDKIAQYRDMAAKATAKAGGKYIARGGEIAPLEGGWQPGRAVILEFPSLEAAKAWYHSPEYQEAFKVREGSADFKILAVEGV
ncbi:MAG: DUF1330 domain-containing protein [bacterium]